MRVTISTAEHHSEVSTHFPPDLLRFRMDQESPFYENDDYIYEFRENGEYRTTPRPLGPHPSPDEETRQSLLQLKAVFIRKIEWPPVEIKQLAENIFQTGLVDPRGAMGGTVWPIDFTSKRELHVIKLPEVSVAEAEFAILMALAAHFQVSEDQLSITYER